MQNQPPRRRERQRPGRTQDSRPASGDTNGSGAGSPPSSGQGSGGGGGASGNGSGRGSGGDSGGGRKWWPIAAAATGIAAIAIAAALALGGGSGGSDNVTQAETQDRSAAYQSLLATPGLALDMVAGADVERAIDEMPESVTEAQREQLRNDVNSGRVRLAWLTVWDTHAEDGDVLRFESSGSIPIEVMAMNAKTTIAIPYPPDGNVLVTGVRDGGGGITIALESGASRIAWPTMAPGDTLNLPVTPSF